MELSLKNEKVALRALEPDDLSFLYTVENNPDVWEVSSTLAPYSKFVLKQYLDQAHEDIYRVKQLRLVICAAGAVQKAIGFVDLYEFDPKHKRAGVGILVYDPKDRLQGYAKATMELIRSYCFNHLGLHQIFANIGADNQASIQLFEQLGFVQIGVKKDWLWSTSGYRDELMYQLINEES